MLRAATQGGTGRWPAIKALGLRLPECKLDLSLGSLTSFYCSSIDCCAGPHSSVPPPVSGSTVRHRRRPHPPPAPHSELSGGGRPPCGCLPLLEHVWLVFREDTQDLLPLEPAVAEVPVLDTADAASVELNVAGAATAYCGFSTDVRLE